MSALCASIDDYVSFRQLRPIVNAARDLCGLPPYPSRVGLKALLSRHRCASAKIDKHHILYHVGSAVYYATSNKIKTPGKKQSLQGFTEPPPIPPPPTFVPGTYRPARQLFRKVNEIRGAAKLCPFYSYAELEYSLCQENINSYLFDDHYIFNVEQTLDLAAVLIIPPVIPRSAPQKLPIQRQLRNYRKERLRAQVEKEKAILAAATAKKQEMRKEFRAQREALEKFNREENEAEFRSARENKTPPPGHLSTRDAVAYARSLLNPQALRRFKLTLHNFVKHFTRHNLPHVKKGTYNYFSREAVEQLARIFSDKAAAGSLRSQSGPLPLASPEELASGDYLSREAFADLAALYVSELTEPIYKEFFPALIHPETGEVLVHAPLAAAFFLKKQNKQNK